MFRKDFNKDFEIDEIVVFNGVPAKLFGVSIHEASILRVADTRSTESEHYLRLETTHRSLIDGYYIFKIKIDNDDDDELGRCEIQYTKVARINDNVIQPLKSYLRSILTENNNVSVKRFEDWVIDKICFNY
jgi:hypothetical protein